MYFHSFQSPKSKIFRLNYEKFNVIKPEPVRLRPVRVEPEPDVRAAEEADELQPDGGAR